MGKNNAVLGAARIMPREQFAGALQGLLAGGGAAHHAGDLLDAILVGQSIHAGDGPAPVVDAGPAQSLDDFKLEAERSFLRQQLELHDWNLSETARAIKVTRSALYKKVERFGITREST